MPAIKIGYKKSIQILIIIWHLVGFFHFFFIAVAAGAALPRHHQTVRQR
ncbi:MAG: hypothetical protein HFJ05_11100 [Eubacterium sp.]|nr:hypothetical protein [Eubacterium sp.]